MTNNVSDRIKEKIKHNKLEITVVVSSLVAGAFAYRSIKNQSNVSIHPDELVRMIETQDVLNFTWHEQNFQVAHTGTDAY